MRRGRRETVRRQEDIIESLVLYCVRAWWTRGWVRDTNREGYGNVSTTRQCCEQEMETDVLCDSRCLWLPRQPPSDISFRSVLFSHAYTMKGLMFPGRLLSSGHQTVCTCMCVCACVFCICRGGTWQKKKPEMRSKEVGQEEPLERWIIVALSEWTEMERRLRTWDKGGKEWKSLPTLCLLTAMAG